MGWLGGWLGGLPPVFVYAVVAALVAGEAAIVAGVVLPSATGLIAMGLLANAGVVDVVPALLVAVAAAVLGGTVAYHRAARATVSAPRASGRLAKHWARAERLFLRHGGRAIFLGQWVVGARTLMPRLAGRNGVPYRRFAAWHTPSATLWALWMVGASYLTGASYQVLAARAGRATGALAALTLIIAGLILAGRWCGGHPFPVRPPHRPAPLRSVVSRWHPAVPAALSLALLTLVALVLIEVIPPVVRFSGLAAADDAIADWSRSQWTSDGYLFALSTATSLSPTVPLFLAVAVTLLRWWWPRRPATLFIALRAARHSALLATRRGALRSARSGALPAARSGGLSAARSGASLAARRGGLLEAFGPVLPAVVLATALALVPDPGWRAADHLSFPSRLEFNGPVPLDAAAKALAGMSAGATVQTAAALGLLAWLVSRGLPWKWQVTVWTASCVLIVTAAGSWVYLGWGRLSETIAAILLGAAWAALNAAIWSARPTPAPAVPAKPTPELAATAA
ncbi:VTT domain-containing protein [Actinoplanes oblitus]|uniref:VTT domain-containing protein n=1 Tax=Actinoplanes oblitus TaxID=3040509 RepID=A0ABY8WLF9_9ACTN|nr:VTT domain-containing protein [Actinoplanes oblitus]WIM98741.1 VTT domain-containing protein [Actinoplanes oblitus]